MGRGNPVIVLGDKTDHGGTVIEGDASSTVAGKPIARLGDKVSCPKCKGVFPIIEGVSDTFYSDKPVAIHGHKTSCGATLIGSQTLLTVSVESGGFISSPDVLPAPLTARPSERIVLSSTPAASEQDDSDEWEIEDEYYIFLDGEESPINDYNYKLTSGSEKIKGRLQAGKTQSIKALGKGTEISFWLDPKGAGGNV